MAKPNALVGFSELLLKFAIYCSHSSWQGVSVVCLNWNWAGALLVLPKLVIPPRKSPGTGVSIQHRLVTPWEPTPSAGTLPWLSSKMTESTFFLTLGLRFEQEWERGTTQSSLSQKVFLRWRWGLWSQYSKWDVWLLFLCSSSRWSEPSTNIPYYSPALPSNLALALLNLFHILKHPMSFLALGFALMGTYFLSPLRMNGSFPARSQLGWHFWFPKKMV